MGAAQGTQAMQVNLPPILFYAIGLALVVFGGLRVSFLGAPRVRRGRNDGLRAQESPELHEEGERPTRGPEQRRHIRWGIIWILMGLFLVISTFLQARRQMR
jgi:hypothetical protein